VFDIVWDTILSAFFALKLPPICMRLCYRAQATLGGWIYSVMSVTGAAWIMKRIFKRGPLTYLVAANSNSGDSWNA